MSNIEKIIALISIGVLYIPIIILGIKTIIETYLEYYNVRNHSSHLEVEAIISDIKYPGIGRYSTEFVEAEFEYAGKVHRKKSKYNFSKFYKVGDKVTVCLLPGDKKMNIVIKDNESEKGLLSFAVGGFLIFMAILIMAIMIIQVK